MIKNKIKAVNYITIRTDIWAEKMSMTSFLGVTIHFLLENKLHSVTFGVFELQERHTSDYLEQ